MKKLVSFLLTVCLCLSACAMLTACENKEPSTTVTDEEWRAALKKDLFYNVTLDYSEYRYNDESGSGELARIKSEKLKIKSEERRMKSEELNE